MAFRASYAKIIFTLFFLFIGISSAQLSTNFYATTCPQALITIRGGVQSAVLNETRMGASLLRLHFHDCFVNGCDASILLDDTSSFTGEKNASQNADSVRGFDAIDTIKENVEALCPGVVSCADIVAVAARDSVVMFGGPSWTVPLGRRDSTTASQSAANSSLPDPQSSLSSLISSFADKGFTLRELVALSGAHTIGQARCTTFRDRLYNESNIDPTFATSTKANCPSSGGDNQLSPLDEISPTTFDNNYFRNLLNSTGLLHSDQMLFDGASTRAQVQAYASNPLNFVSDFASAMVKMSTLSPLTGTDGEIRINCRKTND